MFNKTTPTPALGYHPRQAEEAFKNDVAGLQARLRARLEASGQRQSTAELWQECQRRHERGERARAAMGQRRKLFSREHLPPPTWTAQFTPAGSTLAARDGRLVDGAARLLDLIRARIGDQGSTGRITRSYLAKMLPGPSGEPRSTKTIGRHLAALKAAGYIITTLVVNGIGATIGIDIELTSLALPAYKAPSQKEIYQQAILTKRQQLDLQGWTTLSPIKYPINLKTSPGLRPGRVLLGPTALAEPLTGLSPSG